MRWSGGWQLVNFGYHLSSTSSAGMVPSILPWLSQVILTSCSHFIVEEQRLREEVSWPGSWVENGRAAPPAQTVWFSSTGAPLPVNDPRVFSSNTWVLHSIVFLGIFFYEFRFWWCDSGDPNWISLVPQEKKGSVCKKLRPSVCRQVSSHLNAELTFLKENLPRGRGSDKPGGMPVCVPAPCICPGGAGLMLPWNWFKCLLSSHWPPCSARTGLPCALLCGLHSALIIHTIQPIVLHTNTYLSFLMVE